MGDPEVTDAPRKVRSDLWWALLVQRALMAVLFALAIALWLRQVGETTRTQSAVEAQAARAARVDAERLVQVQADCQFYRDLAGVAALSPSPSAVLVQISQDAADAYEGKGCPSAIDGQTHRPFGPPPRVPTPAPSRPGR